MEGKAHFPRLNNYWIVRTENTLQINNLEKDKTFKRIEKRGKLLTKMRTDTAEGMAKAVQVIYKLKCITSY